MTSSGTAIEASDVKASIAAEEAESKAKRAARGVEAVLCEMRTKCARGWWCSCCVRGVKASLVTVQGQSVRYLYEDGVLDE